MLSVRSKAVADERVSIAKSESPISVSDASEMLDTDVKGVSVDTCKSDKDDVVNEESRDFVSGISLTVQTSVLGGSSSVGTAINGVDLGVSVSVHIFCSCVG